MNKRKSSLLSILLGLTLAPLTAYGVDLDSYASRLCRDGGGTWSRVVPVVVKNGTDVEQKDRLVTVPIVAAEDGKTPQLAIANELAQSVRVCDAEGVEYMFNIVGPDGDFVDKGAIPENSVLNFPATVPANGETTCYVFYRNDKAFPNPDRLPNTAKRAVNLDFEKVLDGIPLGWKFDTMDSDGTLSIDADAPYSGKYSVRCDVPKGSKPSWISARMLELSVNPGATYRLEGYIKGKDVEGRVGYYTHIGNQKNAMVSAPMTNAPEGANFDWTKVQVQFTVPADCTILSFGTVLYGTGTVWFDAVKLVGLDADGNEVGDQSPYTTDCQVLDAVEIGKSAERLCIAQDLIDKNYDLHQWKPKRYPKDVRYAKLRVNCVGESGKRLVRVDLAAFENHWRRSLTGKDIEILDAQGDPIELEIFDGAAFCELDVAAGANNIFIAVEKTVDAGGRKTSKGAAVANQAFPGTTMQTTNAENAADTSSVSETLSLPGFVAERNLLTDGDFETVDPKTFKESPASPDGKSWTYDDPKEPGVKYEIFDPGHKQLGKRSLRVSVGEEAELRWRGWRRSIDVVPGQSYCVGYAVKTNSDSGLYDLHLHWHDAQGNFARSGMGALGKPVGGKTDWTMKCGIAKASDDAASLQIHLTTQSRGTVEYDSVFLLPIDAAEPIGFFGGKQGKDAVFQIPAVVKVFKDTTFSSSDKELGKNNPAKCVVARGEEETIQLAVRGMETVKVTASEPTLRGKKNAKLAKPELFAVGNVVVDYPTAYYNVKLDSPTQRKFPTSTPSCDGWIGYWPDPLIPIAAEPEADVEVENAPNKSESYYLAQAGKTGEWKISKDEAAALWVRFNVPKDAAAGIYDAEVKLGGVVVPVEIEVLDFVAPKTKVAAVYDARVTSKFWRQGTHAEIERAVAEKLLERKLSPDQPTVDPKFVYNAESRTFDVDWTEYDAACERYFNELGGKVAYYPLEFYCFGWGVPPKEVNGEKPYPGEWPYADADPAVLRPEYKELYQKKLKLFWDHINEKGWADKMVLYISDEPFYSMPNILEQMKALCDMIHEVDPAIPIYSSTWVFVPEWLGYLDVWGVGHYGSVSEESLKKIRDAGGRIWWTTDGQMCLDTPLCATERLLPYTCVAHGAEVYEFWGSAWYTCDPFESASHLYISQSDRPGEHYFVRYPNGDGYIFYPGDLIGLTGEIVESIRSVQAAEGIEDAGWLVGLRQAIETKTKPGSKERINAEIVLNRALNYLPLSCGSGRFSTRYMADPKEFESIRDAVGRELEKLSK